MKIATRKTLKCRLKNEEMPVYEGLVQVETAVLFIKPENTIGKGPLRSDLNWAFMRCGPKISGCCGEKSQRMRRRIKSFFSLKHSV